MSTRINFLLLLMFLVLPVAAWAGEQPVTITVEADKPRQIIAGFGGTVGWIYPKKEKLAEVADLLFKDLGVSVLRLSALTRNGDSTDEGTPEPVNDNSDPKKTDWTKFDFTACEGEQVAIARAAQERSCRTIVAASWSPPGWMKDNNSRRWGGSLKAGMDAELGELWAAYLVWMKKQGVDIAAIALQNEPEVSWSYPTARFSPEGLDKTAQAVAARIRAEKEAPAVLLLHPEVSQISRIKPYLDATSRETLAVTGAVSVHSYDLGVGYFDIDRYRQMWRDARPMFAKIRKPLWLTEMSNSSGANSGSEQGSWREAMAWARHMHLALVEGECSAVLFWGLYFDKKGEALLYAEKNGADRYEITPKFYTSKNFFRFVRPGMVRLVSSPTEGGLEASAFWDAAAKRLVIVVVNGSGEGRTGALDLKGFSGQPQVVELHRTSEKENCIKLDPARERQGDAYPFPAQSVTTAVIAIESAEAPKPRQ